MTTNKTIRELRKELFEADQSQAIRVTYNNNIVLVTTVKDFMALLFADADQDAEANVKTVEKI